MSVFLNTFNKQNYETFWKKIIKFILKGVPNLKVKKNYNLYWVLLGKMDHTNVPNFQ